MVIIKEENHPAEIQMTWWQNLAVSLDLVSSTFKHQSTGMTQGEVEAQLDTIHQAYAVAHRVTMPIDIQAQLIAAICNIQMSYCARYEGQKRESATFHRIAQVEWVLFQELLKAEGINYRFLH